MGLVPNNSPGESTNRFHHNGTDTFEDGIRIRNRFDYDEPLDEASDSQDAYKISLYNAEKDAWAKLVSIGRNLTIEAIEQGEPSRDITLDPEYILAQERLFEARAAISRTVNLGVHAISGLSENNHSEQEEQDDAASSTDNQLARKRKALKRISSNTNLLGVPPVGL